MGRIRTIKPELLEDSKTASLSHEAWRLFVSCLLLADDHGNLRAAPRMLEGLVFHSRESREGVATLLRELRDGGLVVLYSSRGQEYASIGGWAKHQKVDHPGKPRVPGPYDEGSEISREAREDLATVSRLTPTPTPTPTSTTTTISDPRSPVATASAPGRRSRKNVVEETSLTHQLRLDYESGWQALMGQPYRGWSPRHGREAKKLTASDAAYAEAKALLEDFLQSKDPRVIGSGYSFCQGPWSFVGQIDTLRAQRAQPNLRRVAQTAAAAEHQVSKEDAERLKFEQDMARLRRQRAQQEQPTPVGGSKANPAVGALNAFSWVRP